MNNAVVALNIPTTICNQLQSYGVWIFVRSVYQNCYDSRKHLHDM